MLQTQWNSPLSPKMHKNSITLKCDNLGSRSRSTTRVSLQMSFDTMFNLTEYSHIGRTPSVTTHNHIKSHNTSVFTSLKPSKRERVHNPNQHPHLRQYINVKEKYFTREFLTVNHRQMISHAI
jgi:hypothetical protein